MAYLPLFRGCLPIEMEMCALDRHYVFELRNVSKQIVHHRSPAQRSNAERQSEDRAQVVLELARLCTFDRPVSRVVHARRDLVCQHLALYCEQLQRHYAYVLESVHDASTVFDRTRRQFRRDVWC